MYPSVEQRLLMTRRYFLSRTATGIGAAALASLLNPSAFATTQSEPGHGILKSLHFAPKAKRVIYLFQSGGPSQMDLFDGKPTLAAQFDKDLPDSIRHGQRITGMTSGQARLPVAPSIFKFAPHGKCGTQVSELLPH